MSFCENPRYPQVLALIRQMELLLDFAVRMHLFSGGLPRQKYSYIQLVLTPRYLSLSFDADLSTRLSCSSIEQYSMIVNAAWQSVHPAMEFAAYRLTRRLTPARHSGSLRRNSPRIPLYGSDPAEAGVCPLPALGVGGCSSFGSGLARSLTIIPSLSSLPEGFECRHIC